MALNEEDDKALRELQDRLLSKARPIMMDRMQKDGFAWVSPQEMTEWRGPDLSVKGLVRVYQSLTSEFGDKFVKIDTTNPEEFVFLMTLLKESGGEVTDTVRELYTEKYRYFAKSQAVNKALVLLGFAAPEPSSNGNHEPPAPVQAADLNDMVLLFQRGQKLLEKEASLEEQLAQVRSELATLAPIMNLRKSARDTVAKVKAELEAKRV